MEEWARPCGPVNNPQMDCFPVQLILVIITYIIIIILYSIIIYIYDYASVLIFSVRILPRRSYHGVRFSRVESFGFDEFEMMGIVECCSRISDLVSGIALVYILYILALVVFQMHMVLLHGF